MKEIVASRYTHRQSATGAIRAPSLAASHVNSLDGPQAVENHECLWCGGRYREGGLHFQFSILNSQSTDAV
jgi:hypothetical protein